MSDIHETGTYNTGPNSIQAAMGHFNEQGIAFAIDTGDMATGGTAAQFTAYLADKAALWSALYSVPGNHDYYATQDLTNYTAAGLDGHFAVDIGNFRLVGVTAPPHVKTAGGFDGYFDIEQGELDYIDAAITGAAGKTVIVVSHPDPSTITTVPGGFADMVAWCVDRGITAWFCGHDHLGCYETTISGVQIVHNGSLYYDWTTPGKTTQNLDGSMCICTVYDDRIEIDCIGGRWPFAPRGPGDLPAYTLITVLR